VECVIFVGLPGAGKSTLYRQRFADTHMHISKDLWPNASGRERRQQKLIDETLAAGKSIVMDNTNPTVAERERIMAVAKAHGARVIGYFFDVTTRAAVARNANRTGRGKVPNVAIFTTAKRLQRPSLAEGFDELFHIELAEDHSFRVTKIKGKMPSGVRLR
jgi:predicted kinase